MGSGLPRVITREIDLSQYVDTLIKGVSCIEGITEKGPVGKPQLISSEAQFERVFGGNLKNSDFPFQNCKTGFKLRRGLVGVARCTLY